MTWHPIDDRDNPAPRDGTIVLVAYAPDGRTHLVAKYGLASWTKWGDGEIEWDHSNWTWSMKPTHWAPFDPLPPPPEQE